MALAATFRFSGYRVLLGDGADPEVFAAPCGFTERSISFNRELSETNTPDCADEDAPSWLERDVTSMSATINGTGVLEATALPIWLGLLNTTVSFNARVELWREGVKVGHWQGAFALESFETSGTKGERVQVTVSMQSDGVVAYTAA
ncbi:phage tail tube protein [Bosea sp. FBZP-16]|uniref:phage tail tube protein n=1 Tax=Bosea sp. FBZP-16 TaxID=2065382 RepID=UPI000C304337|nr:phage tail tube protein [Bosea sp. FBZP-16]